MAVDFEIEEFSEDESLAVQKAFAAFDPAVIGGSAGVLLLAFAFSTGRADPQLKMNSGKASSGDHFRLLTKVCDHCLRCC